MGEYILRPTKCVAVAGYLDDDPDYPLANAYDNDKSTAWRQKNTISYDRYYRTFYGFDFAQIPNTEVVTDVKVGLRYSSSGTSTSSGIVVFPVSKKTVDSNPNPSILIENNAPLPYKSYYGFPLEYTTEHEELSNSFILSKDYINNFKQEIISGEKIYGILFQAHSSRYTYLYDIYLRIETVVSAKIFLGETPVTSAYLGNTKLSGIYLGTNQLL